MSGERMECAQLSVDRMVSVVSKAYAKVIYDGTSLQKVPTIMLWGPPGVGKSQGVRQIAQEVERVTGKRVVVTDVRLILFNPVDLRGIPTFDATRSFSIWLKPKILDMDEGDDVINFLFLDEISAAPPSVQAAAYQIALDRRVGEHELPQNCAVLAAGNRVSDKSVSYKMPRALANRLMHFEILPDFASWREWAVCSGVDSRVIGFLTFRKEWFLPKDDIDSIAFPSPRTWEMVSNVLRYCEADAKKAGPMIKGLVGSVAGREFISWCAVNNKLPSIEGIFAGAETTIPTSSDELYALVSAMSDYAKEHRNDDVMLENAIRYARRLPKEFSYLLFRAFATMFQGSKKRLLSLSGYDKWLSEVGGLTGAGS